MPLLIINHVERRGINEDTEAAYFTSSRPTSCEVAINKKLCM